MNTSHQVVDANHWLGGGRRNRWHGPEPL